MVGEVRDGRQSLVYLVTPKTGSVSTTLTAGKFYWITGMAATGSKFEGLKVGHAFYASSEVTLTSGDTAVEMTFDMLGFATSKSLSMSKNATDVTADKDESSNFAPDGMVAVSGTVNGYDWVEEGFTAISKIKTMFNDYIDFTGSSVTVHEGDYKSKCCLAFFWDLRGAKDGDIMDVDFLPSIITGLDHDSSYQSGQTMDLTIQGCATDDEGHRRSIVKFAYKEGVVA